MYLNRKRAARLISPGVKDAILCAVKEEMTIEYADSEMDDEESARYLLSRFETATEMRRQQELMQEQARNMTHGQVSF